MVVVSVAFNSIKDYQNTPHLVIRKASQILSIPSRIISKDDLISVSHELARHFQFHQGLSWDKIWWNPCMSEICFQFHQGLSEKQIGLVIQFLWSFQFHQGLSSPQKSVTSNNSVFLSIPSRIIDEIPRVCKLLGVHYFQFHQGLSKKLAITRQWP